MTIICRPVHTFAWLCGIANGAGGSLRQVPGTVDQDPASAVETARKAVASTKVLTGPDITLTPFSGSRRLTPLEATPSMPPSLGRIIGENSDLPLG
jgi:hypothetical protein